MSHVTVNLVPPLIFVPSWECTTPTTSQHTCLEGVKTIKRGELFTSSQELRLSCSCPKLRQLSDEVSGITFVSLSLQKSYSGCDCVSELFSKGSLGLLLNA